MLQIATKRIGVRCHSHCSGFCTRYWLSYRCVIEYLKYNGGRSKRQVCCVRQHRLVTKSHTVASSHDHSNEIGVIEGKQLLLNWLRLPWQLATKTAQISVILSSTIWRQGSDSQRRLGATVEIWRLPSWKGARCAPCAHTNSQLGDVKRPVPFAWTSNNVPLAWLVLAYSVSMGQKL